ncbi:MAG: hypothetical protein IJS58_09550 [Bacilli bacterium]|nr:hypothetical protein [Bacilli bacterium]
MSTIQGINRFIVPNDVITSLAEVYKSIGLSENYKSLTEPDFSRIVNQTIERDTFFLSKLVNIDISDNRLRLIITKSSTPRTNDEKILYTIKELLTDFAFHPDKVKIDSQTLFNLVNYIYPKMGIKFDVYKDDKRNNYMLSGKAKREILDEINKTFNTIYNNNSVEKIILSINYYVDLVSLKPFTAYNEIVPYLVLYLLLNKIDYRAVQYVSLFENIYYNKADFDDELQNACFNWEEGYHQVLPFVRYFIKMLSNLFNKCNNIIASYIKEVNVNKADNIENTIMSLPNIFTKEEIRLTHPYVSDSTINRALKKLHEENIIRPLGKGRSAKWLKVGLK